MAEFVQGTHKSDRFIDLHKTQGRVHDGLSRAQRMSKNPEMFIGLNDELVKTMQRNYAPPAHLVAHFKEVFDEDQRREIALILHPMLKRWSIFERRWFKGEPIWHPVCVFHDGAKPGYLPEDLQRSDRLYDHLRGTMGDHRQPTRKDFEFIERCDMKKYGAKDVCKYIERFEIEAEEEAKRQWDDYVEDFLDYHFWLAMRDAQSHYSNPWSVDAVELKSDPSRYKVEEVIGENGTKIKIKRRVFAEEGDENEMRAALEGKIDRESHTGRAIHAVLETKNRKYKERTGMSLYERVMGRSCYWPEEEEEKARTNTQEAEKLTEIATSEPAMKTPISEQQTIEDWLRERAKEADLLPVGSE